MSTTRAGTQPSFAARQRLLRGRFRQLKADSILVTNLLDVRYLCGFTGSNAALAIAPAKCCLFTDGRYTVQAAEETSAAKVKIVAGSAAKAAVEWLDQQRASRCLIDTATTTLAAFRQFDKYAKPLKLRFTMSAGSPVLEMRQRKDDFELGCLRKAAALGCELYLEALNFLVPGVTESEVAANLEFMARTAGAEKMAFDTIVASGVRSSLPHGHAGPEKLPKRGFVTLDFGVILNGYCSDMTRTIYLGKPTAEHVSAYEAVLAAQENAVAAVHAGVTCEDVDEAARSVLRQAKLDKWFTHSTGHGVGLEIHEPPRVAAKSKTVLQQGMVITIEPGVYLPGKFGIRIEDTVAVTATGCEVLTPAPKGFTVLA